MTYIVPVVEESGRMVKDNLGKVGNWKGVGWLKIKCF